VSSHLGLEKAFELLDRLKITVRTCANRAEQLARELHLHASRLDRQIDQQIKELEARVSDSTAELDALTQTRLQRLEAIYDRRKSSLLRAHTAARKHHLKLIESREGREINEVQRELLHTSRNLETEEKRAGLAFTNLQNDLAGHTETLVLLERRTRNAFRGYATFRRLLDSPAGMPGPDSATDENRLQEDLGASLARTERALRRFRFSPLPLLFSLLPPWFLVPLLVGGLAAAVPALPRFGFQAISWQQAGASLGVGLAGVFVVHLLGRLMSAGRAEAVATAVVRTRVLLGSVRHAAEAQHNRELERLRHEAESRTERLNQRWALALEEAEAMRKVAHRRLDEKWSRASAKNEQLFQRNRERLQQERNDHVGRLKNETETERRLFEESRTTQKNHFELNQQAHWQALETDWQDTLQSLYKTFAEANAEADRVFPAWGAPLWQHWTAPREFAAAAPFAKLQVDIEHG